MPSDLGMDGQWERVASELRACREAQQQAWGDLDNATLGRYLAGDVTADERQRIEAALEARPELRLLTDLVSDVLADCEPIAARETARLSVLPFRAKTRTVASRTQHWRKWAAVAAAACFFLLVSYNLLPHGRTTAPAGLVADRSLAPSPAPDTRLAVAFKPPMPNEVQGVGSSATPGNGGDDKKAAGNAVASIAPLVDSLTLAYADGLNSLATSYQNDGDLNHAEYFYKQAYNVREWKLGPNAPQTVEARRSLGDVYQVALNTPDSVVSAKIANPVPAPPGPEMMRKDLDAAAQKRTSGVQLRDRITRQAVGVVRKSVVPILVQNLRDAQTPEAREQFGRALAELGPAAGEAMPVLEECLKNAPTPQERAVVLRVLGELGPTAGRTAAPVIVTSMKSPSPEERKAAADALANYGPAAQDVVAKGGADGASNEHPEWRTLKERMRGAEGRIGVRDECELFSPHALKQGQKEIHELAYNAHVEVFAETRAGEAKDEAKTDRDRAHEINANGLYLVIRPALGKVEVIVGEALRGEGFDEQQLDQLHKLIEAAVGRKDFDRALLEGVRYIARFQAEKAKAAAPESTREKP